jgi:hypothetical protein
MKSVSLFFLFLVGSLICAPAKAVTYTFFDATSPTTVDLAFAVPVQLRPSGGELAIGNLSGLFASFLSRTNEPSAVLTNLSTMSVTGRGTDTSGIVPLTLDFNALISFASEDQNGPGNGTFMADGSMTATVSDFAGTIATASRNIGSMVVSGVTGAPVPEPSTWAMLLLGFGGLGLVGYRASLRTALKTGI